MTIEEALRVLTHTGLKQANLPEVEEAVAVVLRLLNIVGNDVPANTFHLVELHGRLSEMEARFESLETAYKSDKSCNSDAEPLTGAS